MLMKRRIAILITAVAVASSTVGSAAFATDPKGPATAAAGVAIGELNGAATVSQDGLTLGLQPDTIVRALDLTYPDQADSGWHQHPGLVVAVVQSGTVYRVSTSCKVETFTVGDSFTEVGPHRVFNHSGAPAVLKITQFLPPGTDLTKLRIDVPKDPCKGRYRWR